MASESFKLNKAAEKTLSQVASKAGLPREQALGAALAVANAAPAGEIQDKAQGQENAEQVTGKDWIRIVTLVVLAALLISAVTVAGILAAPRSISLDEATKICSSSATATGAKTCDPATLMTAHETNWQGTFLALIAALFTPVFGLFSASVGYYFGKGNSTTSS